MVIFKSRKGVVFSTDIVIALIIFVFIIVSIFSTWNYAYQKVGDTTKRNDLEIVSRQFMTSLMEKSGDPSNWHINGSDIKSVGLIGKQPNQISVDKLNALNYTQLKQFSFKEQYDFLLEVFTYPFGESPDYSVGVSPSDTNEIVVIHRIGLINGEYAKFIFKGWKSE